MKLKIRFGGERCATEDARMFEFLFHFFRIKSGEPTVTETVFEEQCVAGRLSVSEGPKTANKYRCVIRPQQTQYATKNCTFVTY